MSDVSICCRKRNKSNERDTLKVFISYGDSLLLSGKSFTAFVGLFPVIENGFFKSVTRYRGIENANRLSNWSSLYRLFMLSEEFFHKG